MKAPGVITFAILAATVALAQAPSPKIEFEVASIRPSQPLGPGVQVGLRMDGSQAHYASWALKDYIAMAYRVKTYQVSGPDWIATERFDINAKLPEGSTSDQAPEMLQALLTDRFQLKIHRDQRDLNAYALIIGKPPLKLTETPPSPADSAPADTPGTVNIAGGGTAAGVSVTLGNGSYYTFANNQFEIKKVSMDTLATLLERYLDRPVVNLTELKGNYDLTLAVTPEDYQSLLIRAAVNAGVTLPPQALRLLDNGSPVSLFDALQELGLRVDSRKLPLDVIVVDGALQTPTDNETHGQ